MSEFEATVLFVDDEPLLLQGMSRLLRRQRQWKLRLAHSVAEAMAVLDEEPIDAVVSDITMPIRDGFDLLQAVREHPVHHIVPVVILTGNAETTLKRRALDEGAADLLNKPVDQGDLLARLRSVLRLKAAQDQLRAQAESLHQTVLARTSELEWARLELIWRLGKAGEFRDSETGHHVVRVGMLARELGRSLGLEDEDCRHLLMTAPLHDIGKIGIPDAILRKPGRLDPEERLAMQQHTRIGAEMLRGEVVPHQIREDLGMLGTLDPKNPFTHVAHDIALHHHERWDGTGYPDRLGGEDIPLCARITAVVDVYDALCSDRCYKPAWDESRAVSVLREEAGKHFQPELIEALLDVYPRVLEIRERFRDEPALELIYG